MQPEFHLLGQPARLTHHGRETGELVVEGGQSITEPILARLMLDDYVHLELEQHVGMERHSGRRDPLTVFVFSPQTRLNIPPGSGIVGVWTDLLNNSLQLYYEEETEAMNVVTWADRIQIAAGRYYQRHTHATGSRVRTAHANDVVPVGFWDGIRVTATDPRRIAEWLVVDCEDFPVRELELSRHGDRQRRGHTVRGAYLELR